MMFVFCTRPAPPFQAPQSKDPSMLSNLVVPFLVGGRESGMLWVQKDKTFFQSYLPQALGGSHFVTGSSSNSHAASLA